MQRTSPAACAKLANAVIQSGALDMARLGTPSTVDAVIQHVAYPQVQQAQGDRINRATATAGAQARRVRFQFGRWTDSAKTDLYVVLRPIGGSAVALVRRPSFSLMLIGSATDPATAPEAKAQELIDLLKDKPAP
jgi:hypothetical protein